jgi:hypothetical protein
MELSRNRHIEAALFAVILLTVCVAVLPASDDEAPPPSYIFSTLDVPNSAGEFGFTSIGDINRRGDVIGGFSNSLRGGPSFLITKDLTRTNIDCLGSTTSSSGAPQSINSRGGVVGFCRRTAEFMASFGTRMAT